MVCEMVLAAASAGSLELQQTICQVYRQTYLTILGLTPTLNGHEPAIEQTRYISDADRPPHGLDAVVAMSCRPTVWLT